MTLPRTPRNKIYDLVAMANNPFHSEAYLLDMNGHLHFQDRAKTEVGLCASTTNWLAHLYEGDFCHVQGFAESLNLLCRVGNNLAGRVLNDFLSWGASRFLSEKL